MLSKSLPSVYLCFERQDQGEELTPGLVVKSSFRVSQGGGYDAYVIKSVSRGTS